ncbi:MAG: oligopeptide/dipeptide transporter, ATPase subunit, partial [Tardiphaga sp.]|nr:oligopeptide/dipeptide transporter, ATPase subunit [Tardiphaga sp.]
MSSLPYEDLASPDARQILAVRDLRILFPTRDGRDTVKAIDGMDFEVRAGETFGVIGESGSGKT